MKTVMLFFLGGVHLFGSVAIANVCGRSPIVQQAILEATYLTSCDKVDEFELNKINKLRVYTEYDASVTFLKGDFEGLASLTILYLHASTTDYPDQLLAPLANLKELYINFQRYNVKVRPNFFVGLTHLQRLELFALDDLQGGPIALPEGLLNPLVSLHYLDISGSWPSPMINLFLNFPIDGRLVPNPQILRILKLGHLGIEKLPPRFGENMDQLNCLDLENNNITEIDPLNLKNLVSSLENFGVADNPLSKVSKENLITVFGSKVMDFDASACSWK